MASKRNSRPKPNPDDTAAARAASPRQFVTWTPALVRAAIRSAEAGQLQMAAACCAWLLQDARIVGALQARVDQLMGLPVQFQSADKADPNRYIGDLGDDFSECYPEDELSQILTWGLLLGVTTARHAPDYGTSGRLLPKPKFFSPASLRYDVLLGTWAVEDVNRQLLPVTPNDGTWLLFTPYGKDRPWASGLWYSIALLAVAKSYATQDWAKASEKAAMWVFESTAVDRDGLPSITTTKEQRQQLVDALDARGSDASVALPAGWQLKLLQSADAYHIYLDQINMIDTAISVLIRGGNLTTQVTGGSLAATQAQAETGDGAKVRKDSATLGTFLREQSINWWAEWNFGPGSLAPWPKWEKKSPKTVDPNTATAISSYTSAGFDVDVDLLRDEYGLDFLVSYERPAPAPSPVGGGQDPNADPNNPDAPLDPKATACDHVHIRAAASESEGQRYIDRVHASVVNTAPLAVPAYELLSVVNTATSEADLKERLTKAYAEMDRTKLEAVFEQAFILAELAGRYSVLQGG